MARMFNVHDGLHGRDGGPYLDQVEAYEAEKRRAQVEGREPDYDNMPASAGMVMLTEAQMLARGVNGANPSREALVLEEPEVVESEVVVESEDPDGSGDSGSADSFPN